MSILQALSANYQILTLAQQNVLWEDIRHLRERMRFKLSVIKFCELEAIDYDISDDGEIISSDDRVEEYIDRCLSDEMIQDMNSWRY